MFEREPGCEMNVQYARGDECLPNPPESVAPSDPHDPRHDSRNALGAQTNQPKAYSLLGGGGGWGSRWWFDGRTHASRAHGVR